MNKKVSDNKSIETLDGCPSQTSQAGRAKECEGCPGKLLCQSQSAPDPEQEKMQIRMKAIKHKILVLSGKGGVGKSTIAAQLAITLSKKGFQVGLLDVDICGPSIPKLMNLGNSQVTNSPYGWIPVKDPEFSISVMSIQFMLATSDTPVVWRGPRKTALIKRFLKDVFWGRLDYLIIDTPPGTSDEHLTIVSALQDANPDGAVMVTTPQDVSLITVRKELKFCTKMGLHLLGIVENMSGFVCPCCEECTHIFKSGGGEKLAEEYKTKFLGKIPLDPRIGACEQTSVWKNYPESTIVKALSDVIDQILVAINHEVK